MVLQLRTKTKSAPNRVQHGARTSDKSTYDTLRRTSSDEQIPASSDKHDDWKSSRLNQHSQPLGDVSHEVRYRRRSEPSEYLSSSESAHRMAYDGSIPQDPRRLRTSEPNLGGSLQITPGQRLSSKDVLYQMRLELEELKKQTRGVPAQLEGERLSHKIRLNLNLRRIGISTL